MRPSASPTVRRWRWAAWEIAAMADRMRTARLAMNTAATKAGCPPRATTVTRSTVLTIAFIERRNIVTLPFAMSGNPRFSKGRAEAQACEICWWSPTIGVFPNRTRKPPLSPAQQLSASGQPERADPRQVGAFDAEHDVCFDRVAWRCRLRI